MLIILLLLLKLLFKHVNDLALLPVPFGEFPTLPFRGQLIELMAIALFEVNQLVSL